MVSARPVLLLLLLSCVSWASFALPISLPDIPRHGGSGADDPWTHDGTLASKRDNNPALNLPDCLPYEHHRRPMPTGIEDPVNGALPDEANGQYILTPRNAPFKHAGITGYVYFFYDLNNAVIGAYQVGPGPNDSCRVRDNRLLHRARHVDFYYTL